MPSKKFELIGFWEPPTGIPNGSGMFIWHESGVYQTHIVFCRNEAKQVLSGLPIERDRWSRIMTSIESWNLPEANLDKPTIVVNKAIARLIADAYLTQKYINQDRRF